MSEERAVMLRRARGWRDCWRLYRWRNDPSTRAMMRRRAPIGLFEHWRWFRAVQADPTRLVYIAIAAAPVGSGRLDISDVGRLAELTVTVGLEYRGHGLGTAIIRALVLEATRLGCTTCVAEIRVGNKASYRTFQRAGFRGFRRDRSMDGDFIRLWRSCV